MPQTIVPLVVVMLGLSLAACTDEPSESAMRQTAEASLSRSYQQAASAAGARGANPPETRSISSFRKVGCQPAHPEPGHECEFEVAVSGVEKGKQNGRFFKRPDGTLSLDY